MPSTRLQSELAVLRESAAFAEITDRAFLRITGSDATRWLNGMVTNNITALAPGEGNYNFLLNAQGRIQGDCTIYREPGEGAPTFLLETQTSQLESVYQTLDRFIIMDDVVLSTSMHIGGHPWNEATGFAFLGAEAAEWLPKLISGNHEVKLSSAPAPGTMTVCMVNGKTLNVFAPPVSAVPFFELWFTDESEAKLEREIIQSRLKVPVLSPQTLESLRILSATPKYGIDIRDTHLPQETAQTHALHFAKGCYLGQEIVERIRSRGQIHRTFAQFNLTGELPTLPAALTSGEKPVGELTSAVRIGDEIIALGTIRREILDTNAVITYPGGTATPRT
jgi:folate-binding protein YgfZ